MIWPIPNSISWQNPNKRASTTPANLRLAALEFIAACLSVRMLPNWDTRYLDWQTIIRIANAQRVTPALWSALQRKNWLDRLPTGVREYLRQTHYFNTLRNVGLRAQTVEAVRHLNVIGIEPILLKGTAALFIPTFDDIGSRIMRDIDILVPVEAAEECWSRMHVLGYCPAANEFDYSRHHHLRCLYRPADYGALEIHRQALPDSVASMLPIDAAWKQLDPIAGLGIRMSALTPTYRMLHNIVHAGWNDQAYARGGIALRSLHELAMLQNVADNRIDYTLIRETMKRYGQESLLQAWFYLAHRLFGIEIPSSLQPIGFSARVHFSRARLQFQHAWAQQVVDQMFWFSADAISERYRCPTDPWSLAKGRCRLSIYFIMKYSAHTFRWGWRRLLRHNAIAHFKALLVGVAIHHNGLAACGAQQFLPL